MVRPRRRAAPARCAAALPPLRRAGRRLRRARRRVLGRRRPCLLLLVPVVRLDRHDRPGPAPPRARGGRLGFGRDGPRSGRSRSRARRHLRRHPGRLAGLAPPEPPGETARAPVDRLEEISGLLAEVACGTVARGVDPADATGGGGVHALQFEDTGHLTSAAARRGREAAGASIQPQVKAVMAEQATWPAAAPARTWRRVGAGWEDRPMTTLGAVFLPQLPPERLRGVARLADESGLEELWLWEDCFRESGVAAAAAALAWTERLRVGVGLLPVPLRNVALTAMEVATLHRLFPGRVRVGVGHGVQDWMRQVGAGADSPITLLREYVVALRALLRGEEVTTDGARPARRRRRAALAAAVRRARRRDDPHRGHDRGRRARGPPAGGGGAPRRRPRPGAAAHRLHARRDRTRGAAASPRRGAELRRRPGRGRGRGRRGGRRRRRAALGGGGRRFGDPPADRRRPRPGGLHALRGTPGPPAGPLRPPRASSAASGRVAAPKATASGPSWHSSMVVCP